MRLTKMVMFFMLLGGLTLLGAMLWRVGYTGLLDSFRAMGFWLVPYLFLRVGSTLLHTAGWAACFPGPRLPCTFWRLALVARAGSAINQVTPTANIGGEIVKVLLLEPFLPRARATAAVVIDKASTSLAQIGYLTLGMLYLTQYLPLPTALQLSAALTLGLVILGLSGFVILQRYGLLSKSLERLASSSGRWQTRLQRFRHHVALLDIQFVTYYTCHPWRFVRSLLWHGAGSGYDILKTYLLLRFLLGADAPGIAHAAMVAIAVAALDEMLFFVPARLGTLEGARFLVLSALGVSQIYSLAFGLIARVEQLVWSGLGLLAYAYCTRRFPRASPQSTAPVSSSS